MFSAKKLYIYLIIVLVGALYFFTLAPGVYLEDSGELASAAYFLGIAHPSGYPLYVLIGKLFTFLPFGEIAFRLNLMSAFFGVASAVMIFLGLLEFGKILKFESRTAEAAAFVLSFFFAVSRDMWSQAIVAEVYTLNVFLVALFIFLFLKWWQNLSNHYLGALAFLSGLGLTNHELFAFILPVFWPVIFWKSPSLLRFGKIIPGAALFLAGFSVYLFIPLRAVYDPVINFTHVKTWVDAANHVLRTTYDDLHPGKGAVFFYLFSFFKDVVTNFNWIVPALGLSGLAVLIKKKQAELATVLLGGFLTSSFLVIFLRKQDVSLVGEFIDRTYFFQAYVFLIFLAFAFFAVSNKIVKSALVLVLASSAAIFTWGNFSKVDLSTNLVSQYYEQKLESLPLNSVYITMNEGFIGDSETFVLFYLQKVRGFRPDVVIIDRTDIFGESPDYRKMLDNRSLAKTRKNFLDHVLKKYGASRSIYTSFTVEASDSQTASVPTPFASRLLLGVPEEPVADPADIVSRLRDLPRQTWDMAYQDFSAAANRQLDSFRLTKDEAKKTAK